MSLSPLKRHWSSMQQPLMYAGQSLPWAAYTGLQNMSRRSLAAAVTLVLLSCWLFLSSYESVGSGSLLSKSQHLTDPGDIRHILNETLGFQKIFVINLPSRPDKRDAMSLAARLTGIKFEYIDAVDHVNPKTIPPQEWELGPTELYNWRSHMLAVRRIVEEGLTSALVLEDDVDWDIRIKSLMQNFARGSRTLLQPLRHSADSYLDPTRLDPGHADNYTDIDVARYADTQTPQDSPYGDTSRWDLLWLGHCGYKLPVLGNPEPRGRAIMHDETVPETQHIGYHFGNNDLMTTYPNHTRVYSHVHDAVCLLSYALSQSGAQKWLLDNAVERITAPSDVMYSQTCSGQANHTQHSCVTVQPQLFEHFRTAGNKTRWSDISLKEDVVIPFPYTRNIRWSTRLNMGRLVEGRTDYYDMFPDGEATPDLGSFA